MIQFLLERLRATRFGGPVIFATTQRADDDALAELVRALGVPVFRGADADVAGRYLGAAREFELDWIVRVTGDCPFVDAESLDACLAQWSPAEDDRHDIDEGRFSGRNRLRGVLVGTAGVASGRT